MLNIRSTSICHRLNDVDRLPFSDPNDERLDFVLRMVTFFKQMDNSVRGHRIRGLTGETSNALHQTLIGIIDLIKILLSQGHRYVLPVIFPVTEPRVNFGFIVSQVEEISIYLPNKNLVGYEYSE